MKAIRAKNANDAFAKGIFLLSAEGQQVPSRNGDTLEMPEAASVMFLNPRERVLFDAVRDSNPFLGFFEALWIIMGREDVKFLRDIVPNMASYTDDGYAFYGAYGYRMRRAGGWDRSDQVAEAIRRLKTNPEDRQVVLTIRKPEDMWYLGKDQPCNMMVDCKVRNGKLNIQVFNRSNDFVWGMLGTNVVQFSTLQEYMAGMIGCGVGHYHQTTSSMHVYLNPQWEKIKNASNLATYYDPYEEGLVKPYDMMQGSKEAWHRDLDKFFSDYDNSYPDRIAVFESPYFKEVVQPMWSALRAWKRYQLNRTELNKSALILAISAIQAQDWHLAVQQWVGRRFDK